MRPTILTGRGAHGLLLVVVIAVCLAIAPMATSGGYTAPELSGPASHPVECPIPVPDVVEVDCGELAVPEDYENPTGAQIRLPYMVLRSLDPEPEPDPVVFTAGGPGFSSLDSVWRFADSPLLNDRNIIIFEQRGNRYATPALMCDRSVWWVEATEATSCLDRIHAAGIDISQYSTANIARDVVALRRALGYDRWNLYGSSFSTAVMLLVMDADPGGTRGAILQSVKPPDETTFAHRAESPLRAIEQVFADCEADDGCAASYPDLEEDFHTLVRKLNDEPIEMEIATTAGSGDLSFDGHHFIDWIVVNQLYQPVFPDHDPAYLPLLIHETLNGDARPLEIAAQSYWTSTVEHPNWAWGLMFAVNCQEDVPAAGSSRSADDLDASERLDGFARSEAQLAICGAWDLPPSPPAATDSVQSDVPALVLAGTYDPVTPPEWSRKTAEALSNGTYVEFPRHGHDVTTDNPCTATLEARFLADPTGDVDTDCVEAAPQPEFVQRDDVYLAPGLQQSATEVSLGAAGGVAWIEAIAAVSSYGAMLTTTILVVVGLVWLARRSRSRVEPLDRTALLAYVLSLGAGASTLAVWLLLDRVTGHYANRSTLAYALGPSRDLASAVVLAWVAPLAGLVVLVLTAVVAWSWLRSRWWIPYRVLTTFSATCALGVVVLGLRWDLFRMLL